MGAMMGMAALLPSCQGGSGGGKDPGEGGDPGDGGAPTVTRSPCDGSAAIRLAISTQWNGPPVEGQGVALEHGAGYLFVTGKCEYAAYDYGPVWRPVRGGTLSASDALALAEALHYAEWPAYDTRNLGPDDAPRDASSTLFSNGAERFGCFWTCDVAQGPGPIEIAASEWLEDLYSRGEDFTGPLRLRVFEADPVVAGPFLEWPLATSLGDLAQPPGGIAEIEGPATLIDDPDDAATLRALRGQLSAGNPPAEVAFAKEGDTPYLFVFRDVLPWENESGALPGVFEP